MTAENEMPENKKVIEKDEIDFDVIINNLQSFFLGIMSWMGQAVNIVFRNKLLVTSLTLLGIACSVALYKVSSPVYETELMLTSGDVNNHICYEKISSLQHVVHDNTPAFLGTELNISESDAKNIHDIEFRNADRNIDPEDSIMTGEYFRIYLQVNDRSIIPGLQEALINYLENNKYSSIRRELKKQKIESQINNLQQNIQGLDSLKIVIAKSLIQENSQPGLIFGEPLDPVPVFERAIDLYEQQLDHQTDLLLIKNIEVVNEYVPYEKPIFPKLSIFIPVGAFLGFILALFIASVKEKKRTAKTS